MNNQNPIVCLLIVCLSFLISCSSEELSPREYIQWVEDRDNGLYKEKSISEVKYAIQYKPIAYIVLKTNDHITMTEFNKKHAEYENLEYFNLFIDSRVTDKKKDKEYNSNLTQFYSFDIQKHLFIVESQDTLRCLFAHHDASFGIRPFEKFILAFPKRKEHSGLNLILNDKISDQQVQFNIGEKALTHLPEIKF